MAVRVTTAVAHLPTRWGSLAVDAAGSGRTLLCLHGIGSSAAGFAPLLADPPPGWQVVAWDAPGYARSQDPSAPPGMAGYAAAARAVLEAAGSQPAVVLGVSWGGVIATRLALDAPDVVAGLVLVSSTVGSGVDRRSASAMARRGDDLRCLGPDRFAAQRGPRLVSPAAPTELREAVVRSMGEAIRVPGYVWAAEAMSTTDHTDRLGAVRAPTLVVAGTADEVTGPPASERLAAGIPGARLELVPGAGHLLNQERPAALAALLHDFLTTTIPGGTP